MNLTALRISVVAFLALPVLQADTPKSTRPQASPEAVFTKTVQPFLANNCVACHNGRVKSANLDLQQFDSVESVRANLKVWRKIAWKLEQGDMPPAKSPQPKATAKKAVIKWVHAELKTAQK